jgi:hypothetical protein
LNWDAASAFPSPEEVDLHDCVCYVCLKCFDQGSFGSTSFLLNVKVLKNSLTLKPIAAFHECKNGQLKEDAIKQLTYQKLQNILMKAIEKAKKTEKSAFLL